MGAVQFKGIEAEPVGALRCGDKLIHHGLDLGARHGMHRRFSGHVRKC